VAAAWSAALDFGDFGRCIVGTMTQAQAVITIGTLTTNQRRNVLSRMA
jgi:hypothetical protein